MITHDDIVRVENHGTMISIYPYPDTEAERFVKLAANELDEGMGLFDRGDHVTLDHRPARHVLRMIETGDYLYHLEAYDAAQEAHEHE